MPFINVHGVSHALSFYRSQMFCAGPNVLSQPRNLIAFSASSKPFVPAQKTVLLNANHIFVWHKMFVTATIYKQIFDLAQKNWNSPKHFGTCKRTRHLRSWICGLVTKCQNRTFKVNFQPQKSSESF